MAGAEEVVAGLPVADGTSWSGLVLNERGYDRLAATPLAEVHAKIAEQTRNAEQLCARVEGAGLSMPGCPLAWED